MFDAAVHAATILGQPHGLIAWACRSSRQSHPALWSRRAKRAENESRVLISKRTQITARSRRALALCCYQGAGRRRKRRSGSVPPGLPALGCEIGRATPSAAGRIGRDRRSQVHVAVFDGASSTVCGARRMTRPRAREVARPAATLICSHAPPQRAPQGDQYCAQLVKDADYDVLDKAIYFAVHVRDPSDEVIRALLDSADANNGETTGASLGVASTLRTGSRRFQRISTRRRRRRAGVQLFRRSQRKPGRFASRRQRNPQRAEPPRRSDPPTLFRTRESPLCPAPHLDRTIHLHPFGDATMLTDTCSRTRSRDWRRSCSD